MVGKMLPKKLEKAAEACWVEAATGCVTLTVDGAVNAPSEAAGVDEVAAELKVGITYSGVPVVAGFPASAAKDGI